MSLENDNQKKVAEIEAIHAEYMDEIKKLRDQQDEIVAGFIKKLEEKKMDKIRSLISGIN
ncbi:MAG: hypothetical protein COX30_03825 [Candidatus Moranbacteria bacterium CG23_combo_of_CG06-09_8_20_14_all_39_10]|nr:MAG: hypothetical protein COX30_03825 [Candidatus Moranbacteria bacterium CG23_combo_of_CG06-09_8_20_14_all_39_10]